MTDTERRFVAGHVGMYLAAAPLVLIAYRFGDQMQAMLPPFGWSIVTLPIARAGWKMGVNAWADG